MLKKNCGNLKRNRLVINFGSSGSLKFMIFFPLFYLVLNKNFWDKREGIFSSFKKSQIEMQIEVERNIVMCVLWSQQLLKCLPCGTIPEKWNIVRTLLRSKISHWMLLLLSQHFHISFYFGAEFILRIIKCALRMGIFIIITVNKIVRWQS